MSNAHALTEEQLAPYLPESGEVSIFSAPWCGYCTRLKMALKREGVPFREVHVDDDPQAEEIVIAVNGGNRTIPTVLFSDGSARVNPAPREVQEILAQLAG